MQGEERGLIWEEREGGYGRRGERGWMWEEGERGHECGRRGERVDM